MSPCPGFFALVPGPVSGTGPPFDPFRWRRDHHSGRPPCGPIPRDPTAMAFQRPLIPRDLVSSTITNCGPEPPTKSHPGAERTQSSRCAGAERTQGIARTLDYIRSCGFRVQRTGTASAWQPGPPARSITPGLGQAPLRARVGRSVPGRHCQADSACRSDCRPITIWGMSPPVLFVTSRRRAPVEFPLRITLEGCP
ncbi:hypothetical protein BH23PLA1_BH23PLA1_11400 [soil metagenome]